MTTIAILTCGFAAHAAALGAGRLVERYLATGEGKSAAIVRVAASLVPMIAACVIAWRYSN